MRLYITMYETTCKIRANSSASVLSDQKNNLYVVYIYIYVCISIAVLSKCSSTVHTMICIVYHTDMHISTAELTQMCLIKLHAFLFYIHVGN